MVFFPSELKKSQGLTLELKDKLQEVADEKTSLEDARHQLEEAQRNLEDAVKMEQSERERIVCWKNYFNLNSHVLLLASVPFLLLSYWVHHNLLKLKKDP